MNEDAVVDDVIDPEVEAARERAATGAFAYLSEVLENLPVSFYSGTLGIRTSLAPKDAPNRLGAAESWHDDGVREARMTREGVRVTMPDGFVRTFKSVADAFKGLRLPMSKHVRFRLKLKVERAATFEHGGKPHAFELVPLE
ncbi:hypothetical protein [Burkholderia ambifaria]|uniref:hypothetical protein n=1 Tax=Burkholderia ambifaria TaxID=152480 RepID=UPI002FE3C6A3